MPLSLARPIVFFDLETTGVDPFNDRIVQIGCIRIETDGSKTEKDWLINPGVPIPAATSQIHGITDDMVKDAPTLGDMAKELTEMFFGVDLGGYNAKNFDIPLLVQEFFRIGLTLDIENVKIVDPMKIFQIKEPRTLTAAYKKFCGKELDNAHNAIADIRATVDVLEAQIDHYEDLPNAIEDIHEFCFPADPDAYDAEGKLRYIDGHIAINFGKNKGRTLQELALTDPTYLEWIIKGSFSDTVKKAVRQVLGYKT